MRPFSAFLAISLTLAASSPAAASGGSATFRLSSPQDGLRVAPGAPIAWSITVGVSRDDNGGLALALVDLVQEDGNPLRLDLLPASRVPAGMEAFSRPLGVSNPGEGGAPTGYVGRRLGAKGEADLVQIGGAQNTTGLPGAVLGKGTAVAAGVGQAAPAVLAQGILSAPAVPGTYRLSIRNALANTLDRALPENGFWRTGKAGVVIASGTVSFTVGAGGGPTFVRGDANADGERNISDPIAVLGFLFLGSPSKLECEASADGDSNGQIELTDAVFLLNFLFLGGPKPGAPFPACGRDARPGALDCGAFPPCS